MWGLRPDFPRRVTRFLGCYFPACFPVVLLFFKWATLALAGVMNLAAWAADFTLAVLTFDVWAITTKLKGDIIRIDKDVPEGEWALLIVGLFFHFTVYLLNVNAWLTPSTLSFRLLALALAVVTSFFPVWVLGFPSEDA